MTEKELFNIVSNELNRIVADIQGGLGNVPKDSGNLRESIKIKIIGPTNFQLYIDEQKAPYAGKIDENVQF
jgi:hypothetical protein